MSSENHVTKNICPPTYVILCDGGERLCVLCSFGKKYYFQFYSVFNLSSSCNINELLFKWSHSWRSDSDVDINFL